MNYTSDRSGINYQFKLIYAFCMILLVAIHCGNGGISGINDWFPPVTVCLGLFFFSSGYFYKDNIEASVGKYILSKFKSLIVPLYIWNLFYAFIVLILSYKGFKIGGGTVTWEKIFIHPITTGHQFGYNLPGWIIIPIFMVQMYNVFIRKIFYKYKRNISEWFYFAVAMGLGICGVFLASKGFNTGWWLVLVRMLYFIPFYSLGILYKRVLEKYDTISNTLYFLIIFIVQILIITIYGKTPHYTPSWCSNFVDGPVLPFVVGFLGIAFWLRITKLLNPIMGKNKLINLIADNTYCIMINHMMGFMIIKTLFAFISKYTNMCSSFDFYQYKTNIFYLYSPQEIPQWKTIYLVGGIAFGIVVQLLLNKFFSLTKK